MMVAPVSRVDLNEDEEPRATFFPEEEMAAAKEGNTSVNNKSYPKNSNNDYMRKLEDLLSTENFMSQGDGYQRYQASQPYMEPGGTVASP